MARINQRSFAGGVISPNMLARYDDVKYQTGLAICKNMICLPQGALENRTGFTYVNRAKYPDKPTRLVTFSFSITQTMVLEFGHHYVRFHTEGRTLMRGNTPFEVATPYDADDLNELYFVQSADVMTITHQKYPPKELRRYSVYDWRLVDINFRPTLAVPAGVSAVRTSTAHEDKNADKYTWYYKVTALNGDKTLESEASSAVSCVANLYQTGTVVKISWNAVPGAKFYRVYKGQGGLFGYIGDTTELFITDENIAPELDKTPPYFDEVFRASNGISKVTVTNGGSGYTSYRDGIDDHHWTGRATEAWEMRLKEGVKYDRYGVSAPNGPFAIFEKGRKVDSKVSAQIQWRNTNFEDGGTRDLPYPDYPTLDEIRKCIRVVDENRIGSGAVVEPILAYSRERDHVSDGGDAGEWADYAHSVATLVGFRVLNRGEKYAKPYIEVMPATLQSTKVHDGGTAFPTRYELIKRSLFGELYRYAVGLKSDTVRLTVSGGDGRGAELRPVVKNGRIESVVVERAGAGYTNPVVSVAYASGGSGAAFAAEALANGEYPRCSSYFEQRRCFASTTLHPQHIWMTKTGTESNMTYSMPSQADDRISAQLASQENSPILHLVPLSRLIILTASSEWRTDTMNSDAITPESISVRRQSSVGASPVAPVVINTTTIYCAGRGGHLREFTYSADAGGYVSGDISLRATHLFDGHTIREMAFVKAPMPILWCVSSSGALLGLTYVPEQQIGAWHEHRTDGAFESITAVAEGNEDILYAVVRREIGGQVVRFIERMSERNKEIFLDCAGTYSGALTKEVRGLSWLEGRRVSIVADGAVLNPQVVEDGRITLEEGAYTVKVGLPYTSDMQTLPVAITTRTGAVAAQAIKKNVKEVSLRLHDSSGVWVGPTFNDLVEAKQRTTEPMGAAPEKVTGVLAVKPKAMWTDDGQICIRQADPLPFTVLGIAANVDIEGGE